MVELVKLRWLTRVLVELVIWLNVAVLPAECVVCFGAQNVQPMDFS